MLYVLIFIFYNILMPCVLGLSPVPCLFKIYVIELLLPLMNTKFA
jgi:hypothetical protein